MANKPNALPFNFGSATEAEATLIPVGNYSGTIEQTKFVDMPDGTSRLWVGIRITGPSQAGRFITTLCPLSDAAKSAYKTKALISSVASHIGGMYLPADPEVLVGASLDVNIIQWTPKNTGEAVNDIRTFSASKVSVVKPTKAQVQQVIAEVAEALSSDF
jgi:hypothetical protein